MSALQKLIYSLTVAVVFGLFSSSGDGLAQTDSCSFLEAPQSFNTFEQGDRIVIGQAGDRPYVVLLTGRLQDNLSAVRSCIPDAFLTSSRLGSYIHIAAFDNSRDARDFASQLREALDLEVRVIHHSRLGRR
ncbi:MAG: hypothetical protein AAGI45_13865 [Cyanobacteria bacterium P01_H01_bin.26]